MEGATDMFTFLSALFCTSSKEEIVKETKRDTSAFAMIQKGLANSGIRDIEFAHCGTISANPFQVAKSPSYRDNAARAKAIIENS